VPSSTQKTVGQAAYLEGAIYGTVLKKEPFFANNYGIYANRLYLMALDKPLWGHYYRGRWGYMSGKLGSHPGSTSG